MKVRTKYILLTVVVAVVVAIDLLTKHFLGDISYTEIIPNLIHFETNNGNDGAAWGIFSGKKGLLIAIGIIGLIIFILLDIFWVKSKSKLYTFGLSMYLGGTIGNLVDRICLGYVRDFINFTFMPSFPTFNFADCFLCVGAVLLCVYLIFFFNKEKNGKN